MTTKDELIEALDQLAESLGVVLPVMSEDEMRRPQRFSYVPPKPDVERRVVYAMRDPSDGAVRYVGLSSAYRGRVHQHILDGARLLRAAPRTGAPQVMQWLCNLAVRGQEPHVLVLDHVVGAPMGVQHEALWTLRFAVAGEPLLNDLIGGGRRDTPSWARDRLRAWASGADVNDAPRHCGRTIAYSPQPRRCWDLLHRDHTCREPEMAPAVDLPYAIDDEELRAQWAKTIRMMNGATPRGKGSAARIR